MKSPKTICIKQHDKLFYTFIIIQFSATKTVEAKLL